MRVWPEERKNLEGGRRIIKDDHKLIFFPILRV
jgi:hypothetical protein